MTPSGDTPKQSTPSVVLVTGPSGAGRSTAINALEDLGFEVRQIFFNTDAELKDT